MIGSDLPDLPGQTFTDAFEALCTHGAVVGPSHDGGYYLIGFRSEAFTPDVFRGIRWSDPSVLRKTLERLKGIANGVHLLPPWGDVDTAEDLQALSVRLREGLSQAPATARLLSGMNDESHRPSTGPRANP